MYGFTRLKQTVPILMLLCLLLGFSGNAGGDVIHVNATGWWVNSSKFHQSDTPLDDALKNASTNDTIVLYTDGRLSGAFVHLSVLKSLQSQKTARASLKNETSALLKNWSQVFWGVTLLVAAVFGLILYAGYRSNKNLNRAEMRRAIAGAFVVGIHCLLVLSIVFDVERDIVIGAYLGGLTSVVGFYFGSRTVLQTQQEQQGQQKQQLLEWQERIERRESGLDMENLGFYFGSKTTQQENGVVGIENAEFRDGKLVLSFRNGSSKSVEVDAVYINGRAQKIEKTKVNPKSVKEIILDYDWEAGKVISLTDYSIKVCTSDGFCSEVNLKAHERGGGSEG